MIQPAITAVILAGGQGTRIGGDKGLQLLHDRPLIAWVLDAIRPQTNEILLSANSKRDEYTELNCRVIADQTPGWVGPLAGLQSALRCAQHDLIASVPCDTPFLPKDLIARMCVAMADTDEAVVVVAEGRRQSTIALHRIIVLPKLDAYLKTGGRKVTDWLDTLQVSEVVIDDANAFNNINTVEELAAANQTFKL